MKRTSTVLLLAAGIALAGPALADDPPKLGGFVLGARLGLAFPGGKALASDSASISHTLPVAVPIELDVGGRFAFGLGLGGYFQIAPGATANCPPDATCRALSLRFGLFAEYRFLNGQRVMPWVGGGLGWEGTGWSFKDATGTTTDALAGPEFHLQGGADFRLGRRWAIGPYLALHLARYERERLKDPAGTVSRDIPSGDRTTHTWTILGVRSSVTF